MESDTVPLSSISYAAFYGDVEHEVTEVKSGYRLTLTYNLYFGGSLDSQSSQLKVLYHDRNGREMDRK